MSALRQAIENLEDAVGKMENSVLSVEGSLTGEQRDMFSAPARKVAVAASLQGAVMAKRLDQAIEKVEQLLSEA